LEIIGKRRKKGLNQKIRNIDFKLREFETKDSKVKVTRIAYSKNLTSSKFQRLEEIARQLGVLRSEVWNLVRKD